MKDVGRVEIFPKLDGRNMTMVLAPDKRAQAAAQKPKPRRRPTAGEPDRVTDGADTPPQTTAPRTPTTEKPSPRPATEPHARLREIPHAEDEDPQRRQEALQDHRHRQDPAPAGVQEPHPGEEALQAHASPRGAARRVAPATPPASSGCSAATGLDRRKEEPRHGKGQARRPRQEAPPQVLEQAQGYYGNKSRSFRAANEQVMHSCSTPSATAGPARATSASCGSSGSTPPAARTA